MKPVSAIDLDDVLSATAEHAAKPVTSYATVYTFYVYDHDQGKTVIYPRMAIPATIARMRGKMNEETAWVVDAATLDVEGFYSGTPSD
jgi:hypothetical protein